ncbi:hypothetical protein BD413DRAFT_303764 [Trametes elegans]|nr:hypothetical protein BD413DRAFT_303764 [Trametes elegans]
MRSSCDLDAVSGSWPWCEARFRVILVFPSLRERRGLEGQRPWAVVQRHWLFASRATGKWSKDGGKTSGGAKNRRRRHEDTYCIWGMRAEALPDAPGGFSLDAWASTGVIRPCLLSTKLLLAYPLSSSRWFMLEQVRCPCRRWKSPAGQASRIRARMRPYGLRRPA